MKSLIIGLIGLVLSISVSAEPLIEGRVRLDSGEPVADAQVRLFDLSDLRQGAIARATTDGTGYFALPLASLTGNALPKSFSLGPNYPNPFNPSTIIPYQLATSSEVRLEVFNLLGQHIATLVAGERPAGFHTATWHATDGAGRAVGAGVYIYRMTVGAESQTGRMVLIDGQAGVSAAGAASVMPGAPSSGGPNEEVYGLIVSGSGLVPYVDSAFRVEAGMVPVELVVSEGQHSAGKAADDDCAFCDLLDAFNDAEEDAEEEEEEELIVYASVSDNIPTPGQSFTLRARVQNQGTDEFQDLVLSYYRSSDATISTQDMLLGTDEVGSLAASSTSGNESLSLTASSTSGTYYYGACVASVSDEGDTLNYCSTGVRVIVADEEDQVVIPDANLRAAIADTLGKASSALITVAEMKALLRLDANEASISDLTGLEFATNLTWLGLSDNQIVDLSALKGLTKLEVLGLSGNQITDISALAGLTKLWWLGLDGLRGNQITDIAALAGLTSLRILYIGYNQITDVSALAGLTNLTHLYLWKNRITDVSALTGLTNLKELFLNDNPLSASSINDHIPTLQARGVAVGFDPTPETETDDPTPETIPDAKLRAAIAAALGKASNAAITMAEMASIDLLIAENVGISNLTGLEFATNLTRVYLRNNQITDISPLAGLTNLTGLYLGDNNLTDISPLAGLTNLTDALELHDNNISDISPLASLTNLTGRLQLSGNNISDISPLASLTNLTFLRLEENNIRDISPLAGLTNLTFLRLDGNNISDISALVSLTNLEEVWLRRNLLGASFINEHIPALRARGVEVTFDPTPSTITITDDPTPVTIPDAKLRAAIEAALGKASGAAITKGEMTTLLTLEVSEAGIRNLTGLEFVTNLTSLILDGNNIRDISTLAGLTNLRILGLWGNNISDISALAGLTNLTELYLGDNNLTDISVLASLTNLTLLRLEENNIRDISTLAGLTNLAWLDILGNPLSASSINNHIPRLQDRRVDVQFKPNPFRGSEFDIELVFLDPFTDSEKNILRRATRKWMSVIREDLPDYEFTGSWSGKCGDQSYHIPSGERIDDLRIYVTSLDGDGAFGWGGHGFSARRPICPS